MAYDLNKDTLIQLVDLLQSTDASKRNVVYLGTAEGIIDIILRGFECPTTVAGEHKLAIMKAVDHVAEKAIIDRALFHNTLIKVYNYHMRDKTITLKDRLAEAHCIYDVLGVSQFYTNDDIFKINQNFDLYRQAIILAINSFVFQNNELCCGQC